VVIAVLATFLFSTVITVVAWAAALLAGSVALFAAATRGELPLPRISRPATSPVRRISPRTVRAEAVAERSPTALLEAMREEATAGENRFLVLLKDGKVTDGMLRDLAAQQSYAAVADRRSLLHLASRFAGTPADGYFTALAEAERLAADLLKIFADALPGSGSYPPSPGSQAPSAYLAWLALNGSAADTALAVAAIWPSRCVCFAALADALRDRVDERARAYLDFRTTPIPQSEAQALAVAEAFRPSQTLGHARLLRAYDLMSWNALATEYD
jgi:hypothetical protein